MVESMEELKKRAITNLIARRNRLSNQYDQLLSEPESYGITGSVSATNRKLEDLRKEISAIDDKITTLCGGAAGLPGISIRIPDYRCPYIHLTEGLNGSTD